ncbi:TolC family protein [Pseudomonas koreensis]|uniref:TolC family protein n=1 Tax=Pseudomonas koreensis TaxID=198620 RepID=UPI003801D545
MPAVIFNFARNALASALLLVPLAAMANQSAPAPTEPRSAHFSEWAKDSSAATLQRKPGAVSEAEIRALMSSALLQAVERSPQLRQSAAEQKASQADIQEAQGQRLPQIDLGANTRAQSIGGNDSRRSNNEAVNLNMTTNVFDWGRTSNTIDSRKSLSDAADQAYLVSLETLAEDVSLNLIELEKSRRISTISQQYVDRMGALVEMLKEIVAADRGRVSELTQARARLLEARANMDNAQARVRDTEIRLRKLIGDTPVNLPDNENWALATSDLDRLVSESHDHPAVRQADARAKASEQHAKSLRAGEKPQLNWVVNKSTGRDDLGREQPWQTTLNVNWPVFRGGSATAAREAAYARADAERERKAQQQLDLEYETRTADQDARTLLDRADSYRQLTRETDDVRKAFFDQWYHLGRRTLLDVLIAESDYNNNRVSEVSARFDSYQSVVKSYASAGRLLQWIKGPNNS